MPHHCCVPQCTSDSRLESCSGLSFHSFPVDKERVKKWIVAIRRDIGPDFRISTCTRVCSLHFDADAYMPTAPYRQLKRLKRDAVPTVFNWTITKKPVRRKLVRTSTTTMNLPDKVKPTKLCKHSEHSYACAPVAENSVFRSDDADNQPAEEAVSTADLNTSNSSEDSLVNIDTASSPDKASLQKTNIQLLHLRNKEKFTLLRFSNSDSDIKYYTGFSSFASLDCFFTFLSPAANFLYYVGTENTSHGTPYALLHKRGPSRTLSPMEELFVTLVRLRKGLPERLIGDLYNLSEGHVSKIVNTWLIFLAERLRFLPIWPSREHVKETMPQFFRESYPTTRAIVDCTEIFIEHPSAADCQRETFSTYKHHNTAKGLIAISPSGQISFISPLYAGRCSDKKIIRHCGFLDLLEDGDGVMADRGFDIEGDLQNRGASLIMPSFLQGQDQFTPDQLCQSRNIATVRVHVERAVRKVKEFEILSNTIPITLCPMLDKIWLICCHLGNFTGCGSLFKTN